MKYLLLKVPLFAKYHLGFMFSVASSTFTEVYQFESEPWRISKSLKIVFAQKMVLNTWCSRRSLFH